MRRKARQKPWRPRPSNCLTIREDKDENAELLYAQSAGCECQIDQAEDAADAFAGQQPTRIANGPLYRPLGLVGLAGQSTGSPASAGALVSN